MLKSLSLSQPQPRKRRHEFCDSPSVPTKRTKRAKEEEEETKEEETDTPLVNPLEFLKKDDMIYRSGNHIYFRAEITFETINKMGKLIEALNMEYEILVASCPTVRLIPKPIYLHITSQGGIIFAGMMGADMIRNSRIPVYTVVEGAVVSSGTFLSVVGKRRFMTENSYMLIHQLTSTEEGNFSQLQDGNKNLGQLMRHLKDLYLQYTKLTAKQLDEVLKHDLFWNFEKAKKMGLVDDVYRSEITYETTDDLARVAGARKD